MHIIYAYFLHIYVLNLMMFREKSSKHIAVINKYAPSCVECCLQNYYYLQSRQFNNNYNYNNNNYYYYYADDVNILGGCVYIR